MTLADATICPPPSDLPERLGQRLGGPLPSEAVRGAFAPALSYGRHFGPPAYDARDAAVMVLLYAQHGAWHVPLTMRPATMTAHAGQISFPGGMVEAGETSRAAALRELSEELGVDPRSVEVLGSLSPLYVFVSNFLVLPWVAVVRAPIAFRPSSGEVARVIEVPLADLCAPSTAGVHLVRRGEMEFSAPHFAFGPQRIWGATSLILGELVIVVGEALAPP